jgi:hypothetical protein
VNSNRSRSNTSAEISKIATFFDSLYRIFSQKTQNSIKNAYFNFIDDIIKRNLLRCLNCMVRCLHIVTPPLTLKKFGLIYAIIYHLILSQKGTIPYPTNENKITEFNPYQYLYGLIRMEKGFILLHLFVVVIVQ